MTEDVLPFWQMVSNPFAVGAVISANSLAIALSVLISTSSYPPAIARSLKIFGVGKLIAATGFAMVALRGEVDAFWGVVVGNTLAVGGFSVNLIALWVLQSRPIFYAGPTAATAAALGVSWWFGLVDYDLRGLRIGTSLVILGLCLYLAYEMLMRYRGEGRAHVVGGCLSLMMAAATAARLVGAAAGRPEQGDLIAGDWAERVFFLFAYIAATMSALNFCLISNDAFNNELRRQADADPLTDLPNRRRLTQRGEEETRRARRYRRPLSVIVLDLDHFKAINDGYGHAGGDAALIAAGEICRATLRDVDMFARLGGEEFVAVLAETSRSEAAAVAELLRLAMTRVRTPGAPDLRLTASLGTATLRNGEQFADLLARADAAMYQAKAAGRNRVEIADA